MQGRHLAILFVGICLRAITPAHAAELGTPMAKTEGTVLVILGSVAQAGTLAFTIAEMADKDPDLFWHRLVWHGVTVPFAPITLRGYELALSDGSERDRCRALGVGFLQGAAYSGAITLLTGIRWAAHSKQMRYGEEIVVYIDYAPILISHFSISMVFLTVGFLLATETYSDELAKRARVQVVPWGSHRSQGLAIVGRF